MDKSNEELRAVFDDFDKDGNGYLDAGEIVVAAGQLGMKVTKEELTAVFKKVDKNFDGKITFDEFATWWRLGEGNKLEALVYLKLKSLQLLKKANVMHERLGGLLENKYGDDNTRTFHLGVQVGEPEEKTVSELMVNFNNESVQQHFDAYTGGLENVSNEKITVVLRLASENPEDAKDELQEKVEEVMAMVEQVPQASAVLKDLDIQFGCDEKYVKVGVTCNVPMVQDMVDMASNQVNMMLGDQVSAQVKGKSVLGTDVATVLESTVAQVYPALSAELDVQVQGHALKNLIGGQLQRLNENTKSYKMMQYLMMSLGFLLRGGKVQLNLNKVDLDQAMQQSPLGQMKDMQVKNLVASVAPMAQGMMQQAPPVVKDFLEVFKDNFLAEMGLMAYVPKLCVVSEMRTSGVEDLYNLLMPSQ